MLPNGAERYRMVPNGTELYKMVQNGTKWYRMVPNSCNIQETFTKLSGYIQDTFIMD